MQFQQLILVKGASFNFFQTCNSVVVYIFQLIALLFFFREMVSALLDNLARQLNYSGRQKVKVIAVSFVLKILEIYSGCLCSAEPYSDFLRGYVGFED